MRMPFHIGLFYNAMVGLLGREPDVKICLGYDGFYEFRYEPRGETEARLLREHARTIAQWLDIFEIQFSDSRCEYGKPVPSQPEDKEMLQIKISTIGKE